jgi:hypothetical protein
MKRYLMIILVLGLAFVAFGTTQLVRVHFDKYQQEMIPWGSYDVAGFFPSEMFVDLFVDADELSELHYLGLFDIEIVYDNVEESWAAFIEREKADDSDDYRSPPTGYHDWDYTHQWAQDLAAANPSIVRYGTYGTSLEGRDLFYLKISDSPGTDDTSEPDVVLNAVHHAREITTHEILMRYTEYLVDNYGSDDEVNNIVNNREIWIIPVVNPDGLEYVFNTYDMWRKNRRDVSGSSYWGVDPNRNYEYKWGYDNSGSSPNPSSDTYRGTAGRSEPCVDDLCTLYEDLHDSGNDVKAIINFHSYSDLILYPWGYISTVTDHNYLFAPLAEHMATYNGYAPGPSHGLYNTNGDATDWNYGNHLSDGTQTTDMILGFTFECGDYGENFQPPYGNVTQQFNENLQPMLDFCTFADDYQISPNPPVLVDPADDDDGIYRIEWAAPTGGQYEFYQLDEMTGYSIGADDCESDFNNWSNDGFQRSSSQHHSGSYSYWSRNSDRMSNSMTSSNAVTVASGDSFTYWTRYGVESNYDYGYAEISTDGVSWNNLFTFQGSQSSWTQKSHSLSSYVGEDVFFRFRYTSDGNTNNGGIYLDDIDPIVSFAATTTIADDITNEYYDISGQSGGTYYYRVRAGNDIGTNGIWGGWSNIESLTISGSDAPVNDFHLDWADEGVLASWLPGEGVLGFNLYLDNGTGRERLNETVLAAHSSRYLVTTASTNDLLYLEVVETGGESTIYGPLTVGEQPGSITKSELDGVWPNPASDLVSISYQVSIEDEGASLELIIFDLAGRRVATLAGGAATAGHHTVSWNASLAQAGVYFAHLAVGSTSQTTRLVIAR